MSISINNTLISIGICACAVLATFSLNGAYDAVQSVRRAAMIFAWPRREQDYLKHPDNFVFGPNGNIIGAASDLRIRSQWQREGLPE
jgi:hypothetical protein